MKKRLLSLLLALTLCLALLPGVALAEGETIKEVSNETELRAALTNEAYSTVKMIADINISSQIQTNRSVTLDLNGHVLRQTVKNERVIRVDSGTTLTLKDSQPDAIHDGLPAGGVITGSDVLSQNMDGGAVFVSSGCTFIMDGGSIVGCRAANGGGVYLWGNASFIMNGGSIVQCWAKDNGGGVYVSGGATFTMNDGTISCSAWLGSADNVAADGTFTDNTKCVVTFDSNGGSTVDSQVVQKRGKVNEPDDPIKHGYTFDGWYNGGNKWNFETDTVTGPMTLKAKWTIKQYTVTFDPDGGSDVPSITQDYNTTVDAPEAPTKYGYTFAGWYDGETKQEFPFTLTDNKTLKAKWTPIPVTPVEEPMTPWWAILPALDETQGFSFADVDRGDWFYNDVYSACEAGLMTGTGADTFSPYGGATRGMLVTVLARMSGVSTSGSPWYAAGQRWAMTNGVSDGTNMTGSITREQLAAMLYRYAQLCGADVSVGADTNILRYADAAELSGYAVPAMQWACGVGLVQGSGGKLSPKATANRAQAAAMLMRFCTVVR